MYIFRVLDLSRSMQIFRSGEEFNARRAECPEAVECFSQVDAVDNWMITTHRPS